MKNSDAFEVRQLSELAQLTSLKQHYFAQTTSPLDGMWHWGFVPMSQHFGIYHKDDLVGYYCVNDDGYLLQFAVTEPLEREAHKLFRDIVNNKIKGVSAVVGAFVSTAEPMFLSSCLDHCESIVVNALMYQQRDTPDMCENTDAALIIANQSQLDALVDFAERSISAPREWLTGYYSRLIDREELWCSYHTANLVAVGECRKFDVFQTQYADLGVIVAPECRGQGVASSVLRTLASCAYSLGLSPICSTETQNISAQKAIENAGFSPSNRIVKVDFKQV